MTNFTKRCDNEAKTYELLAPLYGEQEDRQNRVLIANVFKAMWSASMPAKKIEAVACAMHGFENLDLQETLTRLCRAKVLRSYVNCGQRFYEVNY